MMELQTDSNTITVGSHQDQKTVGTAYVCGEFPQGLIETSSGLLECIVSASVPWGKVKPVCPLYPPQWSKVLFMHISAVNFLKNESRLNQNKDV